ncbi:hypothetical protein [Dactylosporangium sp. NPDC051541]|uniref:hypothetical protein n=1 Tax=Dactylosporangium sp. NPDC051541 TaxID=3363977 RepID=UPI0037B29A15
MAFLLIAVSTPTSAAAAAAQDVTGIGYHYTSLAEAPLPDGYVFNDLTIGIDDRDRVYGNTYDSQFVPHVSRWTPGTTTVLQARPSLARVVNSLGVVGGSILTDPANFVEQAAIFTGTRAEIIARRPGEESSYVVALNRLGSAIVASIDGSGHATYLLYNGGHSTVLRFGANVADPDPRQLDDEGFIAGTEHPTGTPARAFRYNPFTRTSTILEPLPTESTAWGLGINNRVNVLGYSFNPAATERIGVWDRLNHFHQYFVEGTPETPTISNRLLFNDQNLIVITAVSAPSTDVGKSFIVPRPGVRLDLADLVDNPPAEGGPFSLVTAENNRGSLIGVGLTGTPFLMRRER